MENTILMTQPNNPDKPSPEPRENYLTYSVNYTNIRADALSGATVKQKTKPRDIPGDPRESSEIPESDRVFIPYDPDESNSADSAERDITPSERIPETAELPRAARSAYRRRSGIPMLYTFLTAAGLILGIYIAASAPGTDISGSLLCVSGDFLGLLLRRLFWGAAFLISEYVCGFFALGRLLVWAAPLICGLGTGAALAGAFTIEGMNALRLAPGCAGCAAAVIFAARTSSGMSSQLLRLVSSDKNSIVSTSPAAGEYTLRFLVYLAILSACAIAEAALRCA
jgi:hypothetical protein